MAGVVAQLGERRPAASMSWRTLSISACEWRGVAMMRGQGCLSRDAAGSLKSRLEGKPDWQRGRDSAVWRVLGIRPGKALMNAPAGGFWAAEPAVD